MKPDKSQGRITLERTYQAEIEDIWSLWTTKKGIESWWGPEGFSTKVEHLDLRPGGELRYVMTATGRDEVKFMKRAGLPLATNCRIIYTEIVAQKRLAYTHLTDFIPEVEPYDVATVVEFHSVGKTVRMVLTFDAMHDEEWTKRAVAGHESQLLKFEQAIR